jgi:hypothetical protein
MSQSTNKVKKTRRGGAGRWVKRLAIVVVVLAVLVGAAPFLVSKFGKSLIERQISQSINGTVTIDRLSTGWFSSTVIQGLKVVEADSDQPLLLISEASVEEGLLSILKGSTKKATINVSGVEATAVMQDGELNFKKLIKPSDKPESDLPDLDLSFEVRDIKVRYQHEKAAPVALLFDKLSGVFRTGAPFSAELESEGLKLKASGEIMSGPRMRTVEDMTAAIAMTFDQWKLGDLDSMGLPGTTGLAGTVAGQQDVNWSGSAFTAKGKVRVVQARADLGAMGLYQVGAMEFVNDIKGNLNEGPHGHVEALVESLALPKKGPLLREPTFSLLARADVTPTQQVAWELLHAKGEGMELKGLGTTDLVNNFATSADLTLKGDLQGLNQLISGLPLLEGILD